MNGFVSNLQMGWEEPTLPALCERLATFARVILFDKRGVGRVEPRTADGPSRTLRRGIELEPLTPACRLVPVLAPVTSRSPKALSAVSGGRAYRQRTRGDNDCAQCPHRALGDLVGI